MSVLKIYILQGVDNVSHIFICIILCINLTNQTWCALHITRVHETKYIWLVQLCMLYICSLEVSWPRRITSMHAAKYVWLVRPLLCMSDLLYSMLFTRSVTQSGSAAVFLSSLHMQWSGELPLASTLFTSPSCSSNNCAMGYTHAGAFHMYTCTCAWHFKIQQHNTT